LPHKPFEGDNVPGKATNIKRMRDRTAYNLGGSLVASVVFGLFFLRIENFASRNPHILEVGIIICTILAGFLFYMGNSENNDKQGPQMSESAQSNPSVTNSTVTNSTIDSSATVHHHNKGVSGKYIFAIFLIIAIALGSYFYIHRNDGNCDSGSNGPAIANGPASRAVSGNCNK
jgi:hypothetical protein